LKNDSMNPTNSFKDRVVSVAISWARTHGFETIACASTGNLANSVAAYAARAGLECFVFIPVDLEPAKISSIEVFEPNSSDGPAQTDRPLYAPIEVRGIAGSHAPERHAEDDDFVQAGALYRVMTEDGRRRLIANLAGSLAQVTRPDVVERSIGHFRRADPGYGQRVADAVAALHGGRR